MADNVQDRERVQMVAIAMANADAARAIATQHARSTLGQTSVQESFLSSESDISTNQTTTIAGIDASSSSIVGNANATVVYLEAVYSGNTELSLAAQQTSVINTEAYQDSLTIKASANATIQAINSEALTRANLLKSLATIAANTTNSEATVRANEIITTARSSIYGTTAEATIRAGGIAAIAAIHVNQTNVFAANSVSAIGSQAKIAADESVAIANLRAYQESQITTAEASLVSTEAGNETRASLAVSLSESSTTLSLAAIHVTEGHSVAAIEAAQDTTIATAQAAERRYEATASHNATVASADFRYSEEVYTSDSQSASRKYKADADLLSDRYIADTSLSSTQYSSTNDLNSRVDQANIKSQDEKYTDDAGYQSIVIHEEAENKRLAEVLAFAEKYFEEFWALVKDPSHLTGETETPGFMEALPLVSTSGCYTPSQIRAATNRLFSDGDRAAIIAANNFTEEAASRGIGGYSHFAATYALNSFMSASRKTAESAAEMFLSQLEENQKAVMESQKLRARVFDRQQLAYIEADAISIRRQVGIISGITRIISGVI